MNTIERYVLWSVIIILGSYSLLINHYQDHKMELHIKDHKALKEKVMLIEQRNKIFDVARAHGVVLRHQVLLKTNKEPNSHTCMNCKPTRIK